MNARYFQVALLTAALVCLWPAVSPADDGIRFNTRANQLSAEFKATPVEDVLAQLAGATGWEIYVEPDTILEVNARFQNLPAGTALGRMLGNLNYALLPRDGQPAKLFVFRTTANDATRRVTATKKSGNSRVPNELVLTLKPGADAEALARTLGAKITGRIDKTGTYRLEFPDDEAAKAARDAVASNTVVADASDNFYVDQPPAAMPLSAGSAPPFNLKPTASTDASRLVIGLIDTAVQPIGSGYDAFLLPALAMEENSKVASSTPLHGTSMAETVLRGLALSMEDFGNSSSVRVLPVDIYGANPNTTTFNVAWGVSTAIENGATIINLSLGGTGESKFLQTLIQNSVEQGVIFFAAAGNEPTAVPTYPAAYSQVVAVTAGDKRGVLAPYANFGPFVDVVGPGTSIIGFNNRSFLVSGTSSATAYMSGMAAGLVTKTGKPPAQIEPRIRSAFSFKPPVPPGN